MQMAVISFILYYGSQKIVNKMKEKNTCMICLSPLTITTPTDPDGVKPYETPCRHKFHYDCLTDWYVSNMKNLPPEFVHQALKKDENEIIYTCPLCRRSLRQDFFNNMMCKPDGYEYKKTFHGNSFGEPFSVESPEECASECSLFFECLAYRIDYHSNEDPLRCRLYQPQLQLSTTKKKNTKINHRPPKHVVHNVCRKKTGEQDLEEGERDECENSTLSIIKALFVLLKAITSFFQQAIKNLWIDVKKYYLKRRVSKEAQYLLKEVFIWISGINHFLIWHLSAIHGEIILQNLKEYVLFTNEFLPVVLPTKVYEKEMAFQKYMPNEWIIGFVFVGSAILSIPPIEKYVKANGYFRFSKIAKTLFTAYCIGILHLFSLVNLFSSISGLLLILFCVILFVSDLITGFSLFSI